MGLGIEGESASSTVYPKNFFTSFRRSPAEGSPTASGASTKVPLSCKNTGRLQMNSEILKADTDTK